MSLPLRLPDNPLPLFKDWFDQARQGAVQPNPDAMVLATVGPAGQPSARVVLCKHLAADSGYVVFYTNYESRKGRELLATGRAAAVIHWDTLQRQVRLEGRVVMSPPAESDAYFASRAVDSRLGAWASAQSQPLASQAELRERVQKYAARFGVHEGAAQGVVPRPPHWGGFRLWIEAIELWNEGAFRVHDRAVWQRDLQAVDAFSFTAGPWRATRLNP